MKHVAFDTGGALPAPNTRNTGVAPAKHPSQYKIVGIARPNRYDIPEIVSGRKT